MMLGQANYLGSEFLGMVIACQRNSFLMEVMSGLLDQVLMRARGILRPGPVVMTLIASKPKVCWLTKTAILLASQKVVNLLACAVLLETACPSLAHLLSGQAYFWLLLWVPGEFYGQP
ncbi:hypothetical protein A9235_00120 [Polynucleobacter sp. MWH-Tro8-2-5-gr]|nr:hypothetical protein A9235_00120 [Polynucleobacter sp. MWH-Tro8-2-5-gr]